MMKQITTFMLALLLSAPMALAQTLTTYTATSEPGEWQSITTTGTQLTSVTGDYGTQTLAMPFDFMFGQSDYQQGTNITVRADGFVVMRGSGGNHNALNYWNQPSYSIISPFPLKDGQLIGTGSGCWWQVLTDDYGEQMLVIEWRGLHRYPSYPISSAETDLDDFNYQLRLHVNGDISAVYGHMQSGVPSDTLFNFLLTDGATMMGSYMDQTSLRGTWDSVIACSACSPGYRQGNNWVMFAANNLVGVPDSGTVVTWHRPLPPCPRPTAIAVTAIAHDTALLSWTPNNVDGSFVRIQWDTLNFTPGGTGHHLQLYGGDTMHLTGLVPNRQHWLYMRSDCGEDSSEWFGVQFTTPCTPLSHADLPLSEDFEGRPAGDVSLWDGCWKIGSGGIPVVDMQIYEGRPNMALRSSNNGWFHLPPVDSVRTTVLRFKSHGPFGGTSNPYVTIHVGVMDDPFDINTLQVLQSFTVNQNAWEEHTVPMASYSGEGNTVALKWTAANMFFIDDIELSVFDGCLPVESVTVGEVGQHSAQVGWNVFVPADSVSVVWYPEGQEWLADSMVTTADEVMLSGLAANTGYVVNVSVLCGSGSRSEAMGATLRTRCAVPLPLYEDFSGMATLPDCWQGVTHFTGYGSHTLPPAPEVQSENAAVLLQSRYVSYHSLDDAYLLLPFVDTVVNRLRLSFDYRVARFSHSMELTVGIISGDDNVTEMTPIETFYLQDSLWHSYEVDTRAYDGIEGRLVIKQSTAVEHGWVSGYFYDMGYVDNVGIEVLPACDRPAAVWVTNITSTTAQVHWMETESVGNYIVSCNGMNYTVGGDTVLLITGLTPATGYNVGVSRICPEGYTDYRNTSFFTACTPVVDMPWREDFELWAQDEVNYCWLAYFNTDEGSSVGCVGNSYSDPTMGARVLRMEAVNYTVDAQPYDALTVLPELGRPLEGLAIGIDAYLMSGQPSSARLELGLMDDGGDSTTFQMIDTIPLVVGWQDGWSYYEHTFSAADSGRVALRLRSLSSRVSVLLDNVTLFVASSCPRPQALTVDTVTQHTAIVTVTDTANTLAYRFYWQPTDGTAVDSLDATSQTVTLTGLQSGTGYSARVAALCDGGNAITNTVGIDFFTDCDTLAHDDMPYTETFDASTLNRCWSLLPEATPTIMVSDNYHGYGGRSVSLSTNSFSPRAYLVMPAVDTLAGVDLTFWARAWLHDMDMITVGVMADPLDSTTFTAVDSFAVDTEWEQYQVTLTPYSALGHYVAFSVRCLDSTWSAQSYIDDVVLSLSLPCSRPTAVAVDSVGATSAVLAVTDPENNRHYRALVTAADGGVTPYFFDFDSVMPLYHLQLTGLVPATDYEVSVSSVCYDGQVTFGVPAQFATECASRSMPYRQGFETEHNFQTPRCWTVEGGTLRVIESGSAFLGDKFAAATMDDSADIMDIATGEFDASVCDSMSVTFYVYSAQGFSDSNHHYHAFDTRLQIFALAADSLLLLYDDTVLNNSLWQQVHFVTPNVLGESRLVMRVWRGAGCRNVSFYIDDLRLTCPMPPLRCDAVAQLVVSTLGNDHATVSWTPQGNEQQWEVYLRGDGTNSTLVVDNPEVTFVGLAHNTEYYVLVRALCNDTLSGPWSDTLRFTTTGCLPLEDVVVDNITATAVTISWLLPADQSQWELSYGLQGFLQGAGESVIVVDSQATAGSRVSYRLEGLELATSYDVYVRALCGEGLFSVWSPTTTFSTATQGIDDVVSYDTEWTVYPNPTSGKITVVGDGATAVLLLYDQNGRCCHRWVMDENAVTLNLDNLPVGLYYLHISTPDCLRVRKLAVVR